MPAGHPTDEANSDLSLSAADPKPRASTGARDLLACVSGSLLSACVLAAVEATSQTVRWIAVLGLLALPGVVCGLLAFVALRLVFDPALPSPRDVLRSTGHRARLLVLGPLTLAALLVVSGLARGLLGAFSDRPELGGVSVALVTLGVLTFLSSATDALALAWARARGVPRASVVLLVSALSLGGGLGALVAFGETSGGSHVLSSFGVLRREELHLGPVLALGALLLTGLSLGALARYLGTARRLLPLWLGAAGGLLALGGFSLIQAAHLPARDAVRVLRGAGLGASLLPVAARLTDRDGDGASAFFGGGDCDDGRAEIGPAMPDVPGNGVDEDCDGADAAPPEIPLPVAPESPPRPAAALPTQASVLLLTVDTLRYDLGFARARAAAPRLSPELDALARRSTVFERAYALASYTSKSLGPMLLGRYPSETARTFEHFDRFDKSVPFVQERLQAAGVRTLSAQAYWYFFMDGYGLNRGWDLLEHSAAPRAIQIDGDSHVSGSKLADVVIGELENLESHSGRFFFWAHWVDPHSEYVRHPEFDFGPSPRERYESEVAFVDAALGRVLRALEQRSFADRTIVIVTSDHGEAFGEHGMIRHGFEVWEELVRVPLLIFVPGAAPRRVEAPRSLIDVTPTLLEVFGALPSDPEDVVRGTSLLRDVLAPAGAEEDKRPVLVDMPQGPHNQERRAFLEGGLKLVTSGGRPIGLFDLTRDPEEKRDLSDDPERLGPITEKMRAFLAGLRPLPAKR